MKSTDCPRGHGPMLYRTDPDPLAAQCGVWFDCGTCESSMVVISDVLREQLDVQRAAKRVA